MFRLGFFTLDLLVELAQPVLLEGARLVPAHEGVAGGLQLLTFGELLAAAPELIGHRVGRLEFENGVAHRSPSGTGAHDLTNWDGRERGVGVEHIGGDRSATLDLAVDATGLDRAPGVLQQVNTVKPAITMGHEYEIADYNREDLIFTKEMLLAEPVERVPLRREGD